MNIRPTTIDDFERYLNGSKKQSSKKIDAFIFGSAFHLFMRIQSS